MLINSPLPDFSLPDCGGRTHRLADYVGCLVVVNFWSAECPWSECADVHFGQLLNKMSGPLVVLNIASNLNESLEMINQAVQTHGTGIVLLDVDCKVADTYAAQTTPHAFVGDKSGILRYQGAVDDVTFRKRSPERFYVEEALLALAQGGLPHVQQTTPYGCTIVRHT